jgi:hypothetical protein
MKLEGKVALITGAGTGIGTAIAERFVSDGARICITGRRQEKLDEVIESLPAGTAVTCTGDVTQFDDARRMVETALGITGKLDVLVNNAAIDPGGTTVVDIDPELWHQVLETNLTGPMYLMKATIPHMLQGGGGSIINIVPGGLVVTRRRRRGKREEAAMRFIRVVHGQRCWNTPPPLAETLDTDLEGVFQCISSMVPLRRTASPDETSGTAVSSVRPSL